MKPMRAVLLTMLIACGDRPPPSSPPPPPPPPNTAGITNADLHGPWSEPAEPVRVVGNIYYVGAKLISSFLVTTPEGHILIDSGTREMAPVIQRGVEKLGFKLGDIKIMLNSHAHYDHVGSHAALKQATGAQVMVMRADATSVAEGVDRSPLADEGWQPVQVDRALDDGDTVTLGGTTLKAILAPGHTPGCTVWTTHAREEQKEYAVVFHGCLGPNESVRLINNPRFPRLVDEARWAFGRMRALKPDIYLLMHPEDRFDAARARMAAGERPHPLDDPAAWPKLLDELEATFAEKLQKEQGATQR